MLKSSHNMVEQSHLHNVHSCCCAHVPETGLNSHLILVYAYSR